MPEQSDITSFEELRRLDPIDRVIKFDAGHGGGWEYGRVVYYADKFKTFDPPFVEPGFMMHMTVSPAGVHSMRALLSSWFEHGYRVALATDQEIPGLVLSYDAVRTVESTDA